MSESGPPRKRMRRRPPALEPDDRFHVLLHDLMPAHAPPGTLPPPARFVAGPGKAGVCVAGREKSACQDRVAAESVLHDLHVVGVFDGHGNFGELAALLGSAAVPALLSLWTCTPETDRSDLAAGLKFALAEFDQILMDVSVKQRDAVKNLAAFAPPESLWEFGTTAAVSLVDSGGGASGSGPRIVSANVGDSRCYLLQPSAAKEVGFKCVQLSKDHDPSSDAAERERIVAAGGNLELRGRQVRITTTSPPWVSLGMSRSLGHIALRNFGVSQEPFITERKLSRRNPGAVVVCVSDGVSGMIQPEDLEALAFKYRDSPAELCCEAVLEAWLRWIDQWPARMDDLAASAFCISHS